MEFTTEPFQTTCQGASIYKLQDTKFVSDMNFLGGVWTVAEDIWTDNCVIEFLNSLKFFPELSGVRTVLP
jgi:hypothetical protein